MSHDHHHNGGHCCSHDAHSCCSHSHHSAMDHCHDGSCDVHHHDCCGHEHEDFYAELIALADEAWMDVLKCKIKEQIKTQSGAHLDELAKIVSDANHNRWKHKLESRQGAGDFKEKVRHFFNHGGNGNRKA